MSRGWDFGQVGFIYVNLEEVRAEFDAKRVSPKMRVRAEEILRSEIVTYHDYISRNVYGFSVEKDGEEIDACWGFLGDYEGYCLAEAREVVSTSGKIGNISR